jgi:hypothetical protein
MKRYLIFSALAALALTGCTTDGTPSMASLAVASGGARSLTDEEKHVITESLSESVVDPAKAKYLWSPFPANAPANGQAHYCAAINAKSPHAAYSGLQPYLVQVQVSNGKIVSSVIGAIAGGTDGRIVRNLCAKHGLNPADAA